MANLQHIESDCIPIPIPQDVCNYSNLKVLAWNNCTADAVPTHYTDLTQLQTLQSQAANFEDVLPFMRLSQLEILDLARGSLLQVNATVLNLANWPKLRYIDLSLNPTANDYHFDSQLWLARLRKALKKRNPDCKADFE